MLRVVLVLAVTAAWWAGLSGHRLLALFLVLLTGILATAPAVVALRRLPRDTPRDETGPGDTDDTPGAGSSPMP